MSETIMELLKRTQALLLAKSAATGDQMLADRASRCAAWIYDLERWGADLPAEKETILRSTCESWLRMCGE
jgi:hypothetical protein